VSTWYQDAVIYELHVRAFADSDADGIGDFVGLTQKLDYLQDLGVTALWLLPFYPSPLRDEGYDISDYRGINPAYGTLRQFRRFLDEAHKRGLKVITEIVLNHTSDQHPWFQRARRAPAGSRYRDWYVWSDDPDRYKDARIIFRDFEQSNWTWDPVAGQYYWHRFYASQPDLNYDNPEVRREMLRTVEYWLDLGVDGLRLDAVPYLIEREGTSCENLPETHDYLKELRRHVDARFDDRMLLAEANQWPEDAIAYFGDADECHMAFHFPLMPRLFMGLRMEDRFPIIDILRQTPPIPDKTQWAVFLRNHDELTLEMVTDEERDYMYRAYAHDPQMRINLGIRRRLAPLLHDNRQKIELMHGLLCSLPGTPVLYYGDEIGMGDNVYLGDRDGVRTPMQWSADRNAGFSTANPQKLFAPVIIDPEYNYETVNVAAQLDNPESLLWWVRRLIALRKRYPVFGHGSIELLSPDNHRVLAFIRRDRNAGGEHGGRQVLVVANLSRHPQYVELDLSEFRGMRPIELFGRTPFPPIGDLPYLLTLGPHAFYWLALEQSPADAATAEQPALPSIDAPGAWDSLFDRQHRSRIEGALPRILRSRRWFGAKGRRVTAAHIEDVAEIPLPFLWNEEEELEHPRPAQLAVIRVEYLDGEPDAYVLPFAFVPGVAGEHFVEDNPAAALALVQPRDGDAGVVVDAHSLPGYGRALLTMLARRRRVRTELGSIACIPGATAARTLADAANTEIPVHVLRGEQSNTSLVFDEQFILKTMRRLQSGENPEVEIGRALTERTRFEHSPALVGAVEYRTGTGASSIATVAVMHAFVANESDAYSWFSEALARFFEEALSHPDEDPGLSGRRINVLELVGREVPAEFESIAGDSLAPAEMLGRRVGELHAALASIDDPAFVPEAMNSLALRSTYQSLRNTAQQALRALRRTRDLGASLDAERALILDHTDELLGRLYDVMRAPGGQRIRVHGDLHLGQVLYTGRDFVILDFEGEPARALGERRLKRSPFRDVAGMLRSFDYAARTGIADMVARGTVRSEERAEELLSGRASQWVAWVSAAFLRGYFHALDDTALLPRDPSARRIQLDAHVLEKACYELQYELDHRPEWVGIPLRGIAAQFGAPLELRDAAPSGS
jgi:maltose alpha-D-glucosyltransferase/alpha-amylase